MTDEPLSFMARLKRHHIFRVASVYAIAAWILVQIANAVFPDIGLTRADVRIVLVVVALGFPVALILGWMFIPPSKENPARFTRWQHLHWRLGSVLTLVIVVLVTLSGVYIWRVNALHLKAEAVATSAPSAVIAPAATATTNIPAKSIAVLPFENLSDEKKNAYFAAGIQDLILTKLAHIGDLKVIARTSTENYGSHPKDLKTVAQQLGVATILEGSVQKAGNRVLINVQLIDANSDSHLWAEAYTRTLNNIFGVEGEVAEKVADALKATLTPAESQQIASLPTHDPKAYDLFLQGEYYRNRAYANFSAVDGESAIQKYQQATKADPKFALAYARLGLMQAYLIHFSDPTPRVAAQAKSTINTALNLQPKLAEAYLAQGFYDDYVKDDLDAAFAALNTAHALKPQDVEIIEAIGVNYMHRNQLDAALKAYQQALNLDPRNIQTIQEMSDVYTMQRHYTEAERIATSGLAIDPESRIMVWRLYDSILLGTGDIDRAQAVLDALPVGMQNDLGVISDRCYLMILRHDYSAARTLCDRLSISADLSAGDLEEQKGDVEWYAGDRAKARMHYLRAVGLMEAELKSGSSKLNLAFLHVSLGYIYARLGQREDALDQGRLAIKQISSSQQEDFWLPGILVVMAQTQAVLGDAGAAVSTLERVWPLPSGDLVSVPLLKLDPIWDPIRNDPRFQALLKKYENK